VTTIYEQIGQKIRELRLAYPSEPLSQETLGTKIGAVGNTVSRWETGTYKPTAEDLDKLARFFKVPISVFFPDSEGETTQTKMLASALGGLDETDMDEVIRYAEFRKARRALENAKTVKRPRSKR
jgi:transcriptional regulator with XRE-family HTH domain